MLHDLDAHANDYLLALKVTALNISFVAWLESNYIYYREGIAFHQVLDLRSTFIQFVCVASSAI